jgi:hypothetical protein
VAHAEIDRGGKPDRAARHDRRAAGFLLGFLEVGEELHRALVERPPALREADPARGAVEEPRLQMRLQVCDMAGGGRGGERELVGSARKAPGFDHLGEYPQGLEPIHGVRLQRIAGQFIS